MNFGQDIPFLLSTLPSVVTTSDAGNGIGYTSIRVRGTVGERINVTNNGIPLNDPEAHTFYWVDTPDLVSSVNDISCNAVSALQPTGRQPSAPALT